MESAEIARRFLDYFSQRGHTVVPSASLVAEDPTLLLVNAGMVPFKPYFLGQLVPPYPRAVSAQKCVRTPDIDEVGKTTRHATFFQMLGNFSFGDYFKEQAIPLAWELLTRTESDGGFGFPESRLWATVYAGDDEAYSIWHNAVGVPADRNQRRGLADNYWHMGVPGPGGPCSEIYYDRGPEYGREGGPEADEDRYLEVWNLVFMQYQLSAVRTKIDFDTQGELPSRNIDTGMGLERMAALLQGVDNIYEVDTMWKVLERYLHELASVAIGALGDQYPDLVRDAPNIHTVLDAEESAFLSTLRTGTAIFDAAVEEVTRSGERALGGAQAFQLHDTYGFPIDLTLEMAAEQGLTVDEAEFRRLMTEQRQRAKQDAAAKKTGNADISVFARFLERSGKVVFTGYDEVASDGTVIGLLVGGASVPAAAAGTEVDVVLDRTP